MNDDLSDIASALTGSIAADGQTTITGPIKFTTGSAAAPSITFAAETNTGIMYAGGGTIYFVGSGTVTGGIGPFGYFNGSGATLTPIGMVVDWAGTTAPSGWLFLYGQVVSQTTYAALYNTIGTFYNTGGEGAGNFRLPDCRGRVSAGKDDMGGTTAGRITAAGSGITGTTLGAAGGSETNTLAQANLPAVSPTFTGSPVTSVLDSLTGKILPFSTAAIQAPVGGLNAGSQIFVTTVANWDSVVSPSVTITAAGTISALGSGTAHANVQPTIIFNKIIFTGVV